jgi:hypothetical protein
MQNLGGNGGNIKNKYDNNPTEQYIDELFNNWPN